MDLCSFAPDEFRRSRAAYWGFGECLLVLRVCVDTLREIICLVARELTINDVARAANGHIFPQSAHGYSLLKKKKKLANIVLFAPFNRNDVTMIIRKT